MSRRAFLAATGAAAGSAVFCPAATAAEKDAAGSDAGLLFIDNGTIRLGVKKDWGAGIAWVSPSGADRSLIDSWDHGRLVQQSYYGREDGSLWNGKPWRWNPVQGGDWKGNPAKVLELTHGETWLKSRTRPKHWASGADVPEMTMTQEIRLRGAVAEVTFGMVYDGKESHPATHHEIPAFFVEPRYSTLVLHDGPEPWKSKPLSRSTPGWPNESRKPTEKWAAWVDETDSGIGCCVPKMESLTCYRFGKPPADPSACSYFAPLIRFAIVPGLKFSYQCHIAVGRVDAMREAFRAVAAAEKQ